MRRKVGDEYYSVVDMLNYITMADSFVFNKRGFGHGEAKLYVGNESDELLSFFEDFDKDINCFFIKDDFINFFKTAESEFVNPSQPYGDITKLHNTPNDMIAALEQYPRKIDFVLERRNVAPPRVYISAVASSKKTFDILRKSALPALSFLTILKLEDDDGVISYYFRLFFDKEPYEKAEEKREAKYYEDPEELKAKALQWQGCCPFTGIDDERFLILTHIKPETLCDDNERFDINNVLVLSPLYELLFTQGFISINDNGTLLVSPRLSAINRSTMNLEDGAVLNLPRLPKQLKEYLKFHRENVLE